MITGLTVKGVDRFESTVRAAGDALADLAEPAARAGDIVASLASTTAPRLTGRLAASVAPVVDHSTVAIGSDLVYAPPIHNGWAAHHIRPQPFLTTATERTQRQWVGAYAEAVDKTVNSVEGI